MKHFLLFFQLSLLLSATAQTTNDKNEVLKVVQQFFVHLESQDSVAFRNLHLESARFYIVAESNDTVKTAKRDIKEFSFRKDQILKELMREKDVTIHVHDRIATVWAPYDLWINDVFSHCGVDVFTLLKTSNGWKIANCSYTIEKKGCRS